VRKEDSRLVIAGLDPAIQGRCSALTVSVGGPWTPGSSPAMTVKGGDNALFVTRTEN